MTLFNASRQSFPVSVAICIMMAVLFAVRYTLLPYPVEMPFEGGMPIAAFLSRFSTAFPIISWIIAAIITVWTLVVVVQLTLKYALAASRNYLPAQIFLVAAVGIVISGEPLASLLGAWFFALAARKFAFSLHKGYRFDEVFRAGFYLGCMPLLYAPAAAIVPVLAVAALAIYRRSARESIVCFTGLLLPVPAAGFIHWAIGERGDHIYRELWRCVAEQGTLPNPVSFGPGIIVAGLVLLLALSGILWALTHKKSMRKTPYRFVTYSSVALALTLASAALPGSSLSLVPLAAVPVSLAIPYAFSGKWAVVSTVTYCLVLVGVLALNMLTVLSF